ncbi:acid ase [Lecanosticta acicola]|uniref:Acid ase n=1 Tax=Lecanosticta acicola TaxID=111012 RepID=A0AAI9E8U6_9PEZI|nr:acid ase [Lecanosticta acicola]
MKFSTALSTLVLATAVAAAPSPSRRHVNSPRLLEKLRQRRAERSAAKRSDLVRLDRPLAVNFTSLDDVITINNPDHVDYSSNWAGAVIIGSDITKVTGTFTIPTVSIPSGGSSSTEYGASAWVGIDGDTCETAILQTGVDFLIEGSETAYEAWYEWYPDYSYTFSDFDVAPGDVITATVVSTSTVAGTATIENQSTGESTTHTFSNEASLGALCETNAEWIVEDFESSSELIPFADFGSVTFSDASYVAGGSTKSISGETIIDVKQSGEVVTDVTVSGSEVTVTYTG